MCVPSTDFAFLVLSILMPAIMVEDCILSDFMKFPIGANVSRLLVSIISVLALVKWLLGVLCSVCK